MGVHPCMGNLGDAYDFPLAESFYGSLECGLIGVGCQSPVLNAGSA